MILDLATPLTLMRKKLNLQFFFLSDPGLIIANLCQNNSFTTVGFYTDPLAWKSSSVKYWTNIMSETLVTMAVEKLTLS